jgi:3',5'-cyclic AMP phosphodiesterase CpdA
VAWLLAQMSDLHVTAGDQLVGGFVDTTPYVAAAIDHLNRLDPCPDLVLASGDLTESGQDSQYVHLAQLLAPLRAPLVLLPGNHDDRDALRRAFPNQPWRQGATRLHGIVDDHPVRLVLLDSVVPGRPGGQLGSEQIDWLEEVLRTGNERPTVIAVHHPPFRTGIVHMDGMGLDDGEALAAVVGRHRQVHAVLCGHLHRPIATRWAGTVAMTVPSVAHQVALDFRPDAPVAFAMEPPAVGLHLWEPDAGLVSHLSTIGRWPTTVLH